MGMSLVRLFCYAEPFQHGLVDPRNVHWHMGNIDRVRWRDFRSRQSRWSLASPISGRSLG
jgi:hypothetical protein